MTISRTDTIAAVATPLGEGAIAVIRISGPDAIRIGDSIFRARIPLSSSPGYTLQHGSIVESDGREVDEGLAAVFRAPRSYSGEDTVEISCHGGLFVTGAVLKVVLSAGARRADPGEFTRRAYLNGKMDLSRAEAVASLISSGSERAHRASLAQLRGRLAGTVEELRSELKRLCALLEIDLDFSEEGVSVVSMDEIGRNISQTKERIDRLADSFRTGKIYRDGVSVVIVGPPNAGKSSLFNALLKESRAIVTPIAGTTRDYLEENLLLAGILFRITDTAGLRKPGDPIESEGIDRTMKSIEGADVVIIVEAVDKGKVEGQDLLKSLPVTKEQKLILVRNKIDLVSGEPVDPFVSNQGGRSCKVIPLSALTGQGIHGLAGTLVNAVGESELSINESVCIISERHSESLRKGAKSLSNALESIGTGMTNEFVAFDLREAVSALGEITGEITSEDVLNSIFAQFCIGK